MRSSKKDYGISLTRVFAMFLIILTHFIAQIESISFLSQLTNAAIYTFLFISGWLYGKKNIINFKVWMVNRFKKIMVPIYIWSAIIIAVQFIKGNDISGAKIIIYIFNLQGLLGGINGISHLWFTTFIGICYLITPLLQKIKKYFVKNSMLQKISMLFIALIFQIGVSLYFNEKLGIYLSYILIYMIGYLLSSIWDGQTSRKVFSVATIAMIFAIILRLEGKKMYDGSPFYNGVIVSNTQAIIGVYIYICTNKFKILYQRISVQKWIDYFDDISYEMYITHYAFIVGPLTIWGTYNLPTSILLVLIASFVSSKFIKKLSILIEKRFVSF